MGRFNLIMQHQKPQKTVNGFLCIDKHGEALFFTGNGDGDGCLVGKLSRTRIEHASSKGILLSGIELVGNRLRFQEWWLMYACDDCQVGGKNESQS